MKKKKRVSVIGASGAVGREVVRLLLKRKFPYKNLNLFGSSSGKTVHSLPVEKFETLKNTDLAFFAAGSEVSKEWIPKAQCICIDSSSSFRDQFPLIIPEINSHAIKGRKFSSPNCAASILLMPLAPLHQKYRVKRVVLSTYQAASGAGYSMMKNLEEETRALLNNEDRKPFLPYPYAFNLFPHNSKLTSSGYVDEEIKIADETRNILEDEKMLVSATCIRVPVLRAHSISVNVEFHNPFKLPEVYQTLQNKPGLQIFEDREKNRFATPFDVTGKEDIYCGRFRIDPTQKNTLEFWAVGDQLLKGAALNAVQIAEALEYNI